MSSSGRRSGDEPEDVLNRLANAIGIAVYDKRNRSLTELDRQLSRRCAGTNADIADDAVHVHSGVAKRCLSGLHAVEINIWPISVSIFCAAPKIHRHKS